MSVRLFVGNLPYEVTEADLREFFQPVGELSAVIIPTDRNTGKPRGFAFVEFNEQAEADEAVRKFNNQDFKGRNIAINEARARESGPSTRFNDRSQPPRPVAPSRSSPAGAEFEMDPTESDRSARAERRNRNFGADAKPAKKKKQRSGSRGESGGRKGPIRERSGGQFFGNVDDDEDYEDDSEYKRRW
ncbi:MAG: RNA-binding protein [Acidobacteriota bacterium]